MTVVGGLRARLVHDSLFNAVTDGLAELGWFNPGRHHRPLTILTAPREWNEPITTNTMSITTGSADFEYVEAGSLLGTNSTFVLIDLYAENDSLGMHVANDVRDILRGRITAQVPRGQLPIYDYQQATPPVVAYARVDEVVANRNLAVATTERLRHWFQIQCRVEDTYYGRDSEAGVYPTAILHPSNALFPI